VSVLTAVTSASRPCGVAGVTPEAMTCPTRGAVAPGATVICSGPSGPVDTAVIAPSGAVTVEAGVCTSPMK
jgi:hypothetical protein